MVLTEEPDWINDPIDVICSPVSARLTTREQEWFARMGEEDVSARTQVRPWFRRPPIGKKQRAEVVRLIEAGGLTYAEIAERSGVGTATVSRIARKENLGLGSGHHTRKHRRR